MKAKPKQVGKKDTNDRPNLAAWKAHMAKVHHAWANPMEHWAEYLASRRIWTLKEACTFQCGLTPLDEFEEDEGYQELLEEAKASIMAQDLTAIRFSSDTPRKLNWDYSEYGVLRDVFLRWLTSIDRTINQQLMVFLPSPATNAQSAHAVSLSESALSQPKNPSKRNRMDAKAHEIAAAVHQILSDPQQRTVCVKNSRPVIAAIDRYLQQSAVDFFPNLDGRLPIEDQRSRERQIKKAAEAFEKLRRT